MFGAVLVLYFSVVCSLRFVLERSCQILCWLCFILCGSVEALLGGVDRPIGYVAGGIHRIVRDFNRGESSWSFT